MRIYFTRNYEKMMAVDRDLKGTKRKKNVQLGFKNE